MLESLVWSILPFVVIAGFIWFFFVRAFRGMQNRAVEMQKQHHDAVERLLERIAKALEKKDSGSP